MQALSDEDRTKNLSRGESCVVCHDDAQVAVGTHPWCGSEYEENGPCPFCEMGARLESGKTGARRWPGGFWQGKDLPEHLVEASAPTFARPMGRDRQLAEIHGLSAGLFGEMEA